MRGVSLHPLDPEILTVYVEVLLGAPVDQTWLSWFDDRLLGDLERVRRGDEHAANRITLGLANALATTQPVFAHNPFGLTFWEAQVDRPLGMLMRPPARMLQDQGIEPSHLLAMPIRLDQRSRGMGGAWIPARLMDQAVSLLDEHLERCAHRLIAAEYDPVPIIGLTHEAVTYAHQRGFGLYEAVDGFGFADASIPDATVLLADSKRMDQGLRQRIELASQPAKKPGLLSRIFGRDRLSGLPNSAFSDER